MKYENYGLIQENWNRFVVTEQSSRALLESLTPEKINEMFAIADNILGGRRVSVICADGKTRMARIPGKMRRRQWVREGDLIIVWPWDFQDSKADVKHRYSKTQAIYLSRKGVLPEIVDLFGSGEDGGVEGASKQSSSSAGRED